MLPSRNFHTPEAFAENFMKTLTPGVIPRSDFMHWKAIEAKVTRLQPQVEFFSELAQRIKGGADFEKELADSLLASDNPQPLIECAFNLIGHTSHEFVTKEDDLFTETLAKAIAADDQKQAQYFSKLLKDLGFVRLLSRDDLEDLLLGVQIGLETHRRKNIGGDAFRNEVKEMLEKVTGDLRGASIESEAKISYGNGLSKKVDFAIRRDGVIRFGIEANFYTVSGSKPTEIKRSYGDVLRGLQSVKVDLIWITDGKGYRAMTRSLRDAYVTLPNIYNIKQAQEHLRNDLAAEWKV